MYLKAKGTNFNLSFLLIICFLISACSKSPEVITEVYSNDVETSDLHNILGGRIRDYNQGKVLGMYNNDGFTLDLMDLPAHDLVQITFDLYIHDTWDGNDRNQGGPDIWKMEVNGDLFINTTFSNCSTGFCVPQSYPLDFQNNKHAARSGATRTDLPGVCHYGGLPNYTSLYQISKTVRHSGGSLNLKFYDELIQDNTNDKLCDESWSMDNLKVRVIRL